MRLVPIKRIERQIDRSHERARELLVKQRTQLMNATRARLAEFGVVARAGLRGFETLAAKIDAADGTIPKPLLTAVNPLLEQWRGLQASIDELAARIVKQAKSDERMRRLMQIPGVGPLTAHALVTAMGDPGRFSTGRDFAAWVGLTPLTDSSAEKTRIGHISRQGDHSLRRLMVLGAANPPPPAFAGAGFRRGKHGSPCQGQAE